MIVLTYRIETPGSIEALAAKIASDQSTGTFVDAARRDAGAEGAGRGTGARHPPAGADDDASLPDVPRHGPFNRAEVDIGFPIEAVGTDLSALMTIAIGGDVFDQGTDRHPRRRHEAAGGVPRRPSGTAIRHRRQPAADRRRGAADHRHASSSRRLGCGRTRRAEMVGELIDAGVDFIKDDEKLMSPAYSPLAERVTAIMPLILDHEQKTGKKVMYAFGISHADPDEMMRNHDLVPKAGGNCAVVNINSIGIGGMAFLRKRSEPRASMPTATAGTSSPAIPASAWTSRSGSSSGGCSASTSSRSTASARNTGSRTSPSSQSFKAVTTPIFEPGDCALPVVCSGQWGGQAPETYARTGRTLDLMYLCGGGIVSHPGGPAAGVRAVQQAWQATVEGIDLETYARTHTELDQSLKKFGANPSAA